MNITGLSKPKILAALYNGSYPPGLGILHAKSENMTEQQAEELLKTQTYFDYLNGRVMKIDLSSNELDTRLYNRDIGNGAAERIINSLR